MGCKSLRQRKDKRRNDQNKLIAQVHLLNKVLMRYNIEGLVDLLSKPFRLVYLNFIAGIARGFGIAIGLTLITAVFLSVLAKIASLNLPIISNFIARIVRLVNEQLSTLPY